MTGWNLPPGCSVSDIPGNRPIDEAIEKYCSNECDLEHCPVDDTGDYDDCPYNVVELVQDRPEHEYR